MARMHGARAAVGAAQHHRPASFGLVVAAALEFGAGPEVQLHGFDIGLEPVGELVLGDIDRPVRRERHVGQVVDLHLIVQRQRMIALAPVVADARLAVDDQRIDLQLLSAAPRSKARPVRRRPPARRDRGRHIRRRPCADRASWARENRANRIGRAAAPMPCCSSKPFSSSSAVSSVQAFSRLPSSASGISRRIPLPRPCAVSNLKIASIASVPARVTRRGAARSGSILKPRGDGAAGVGLQSLQDGVGAVDGLQVPAQRQHVAPIAVGMKQGFQQAVVGLSRARCSNCASQFSAAIEISSVLSSIRVVLAAGRLRGVSLVAKPIPLWDRAERAR